jgi:8-oxo-dGTP pyrophosphatase MutT (NUDIX family)
MMEIAAKIVQDNTNVSIDPMLRSFHTELGYAIPKVDVCAAVFRDGKLLVVRERCDGGWTMAGGWADVGYLPSNFQGCRERTWEEAGIRVQARKSS